VRRTAPARAPAAEQGSGVVCSSSSARPKASCKGPGAYRTATPARDKRSPAVTRGRRSPTGRCRGGGGRGGGRGGDGMGRRGRGAAPLAGLEQPRPQPLDGALAVRGSANRGWEKYWRDCEWPMGIHTNLNLFCSTTKQGREPNQKTPGCAPGQRRGLAAKAVGQPGGGSRRSAPWGASNID